MNGTNRVIRQADKTTILFTVMWWYIFSSLELCSIYLRKAEYVRIPMLLKSVRIASVDWDNIDLPVMIYSLCGATFSVVEEKQ